MQRLPDGWQAPDAVEDTIEIDGVSIHRAGVSAVDPSGEEVCGSAADLRMGAADRAWFELLERACVIEALRVPCTSYAVVDAAGVLHADLGRADVFPESTAPEQWTYARSNGVALHQDWAEACARARFELAERDRILRSWRGDVAPRRLDFASPTRSYEWIAAAFPARGEDFASDVEVVAVAGFPLTPDLPLALGFGADHALESAAARATREALQQLAFLWGEPVPRELSGKPSAFLHLDAYQIPERRALLRAWLDGQFVRDDWANRDDAAAVQAHKEEVRFVDLTPAWLPQGLRVAKAVCKRAIPLVFGEGPAFLDLPVERRLHPIP